MQLNTTRLLLREFADHDFAALRAIDADPVIQRYRGGQTITAEQTRAFIELTKRFAEEQPQTRYPFVVVLQSENAVIGACGLSITNYALREAELWYVLNRQYWRHGYMTEAAQALITFGFQQLQLHRIWAMCHPENIGSWRVLEKLGMTREGRLRQHYWEQEQWRDSFMYALLDHEWKAQIPHTNAES
jgi:[ribosomal protein S5]-alanine N-acetyltransferase